MSLDRAWAVFEIEDGASDTEIRERYRELVRRYPPDRDPETFEEVRDAYELLRDKDARFKARLFGPEPLRALDELFKSHSPTREKVGVEFWYEALRELRRRSGS